MSKESTDVSQRIRARLQAKRQRFHANDNISAFIEPGELDELTKEVGKDDPRAREPRHRHRK